MTAAASGVTPAMRGDSTHPAPARHPTCISSLTHIDCGIARCNNIAPGQRVRKNLGSLSLGRFNTNCDVRGAVVDIGFNRLVWPDGIHEYVQRHVPGKLGLLQGGGPQFGHLGCRSQNLCRGPLVDQDAVGWPGHCRRLQQASAHSAAAVGGVPGGLIGIANGKQGVHVCRHSTPHAFGPVICRQSFMFMADHNPCPPSSPYPGATPVGQCPAESQPPLSTSFQISVNST